MEILVQDSFVRAYITSVPSTSTRNKEKRSCEQQPVRKNTKRICDGDGVGSARTSLLACAAVREWL